MVRPCHGLGQPRGHRGRGQRCRVGGLRHDPDTAVLRDRTGCPTMSLLTLQPAHCSVVMHVARIQQRYEYIDVQERPHQTPSRSLRASMASFLTMTPRASKGRNPANPRCLVSSCAVLPESAWRSRSDTILPPPCPTSPAALVVEGFRGGVDVARPGDGRFKVSIPPATPPRRGNARSGHRRASVRLCPGDGVTGARRPAHKSSSPRMISFRLGAGGLASTSTNHGWGISRSLQILRAIGSLISACRGTADSWPDLGFCQME